MSNYSKNTSGQRQHVFVSGADLDYPGDATFAAFIASGTEGEVGIFMADFTRKTDALAAGDEFFIAQKRDGMIHKTPRLKYNDIVRKAKAAYSAPVRKVITAGYAGSGSADVALDFTGVSSTSPQDVAIVIRETTPGNHPFPIQEGRFVVTSATQDEYAVLASLCVQLNGDTDYARVQPDRFIKAEILSNGALTELTEDATLINGSKIVTFAGNQTVATGSYLSFNSTVYKVATGVTAGTTLTLDRPYQGASETIDVSVAVDTAAAIAYTSGTTKLGLRITGLADECHFTVSVEDGLANAPVATATEWALGTGSASKLLEIEKEGIIFAGIGSTVNEAFAADYGYPTLFTNSSKTYDLYFIDLTPSITPSAALPVAKTQQLQKIILAAQSASTSASGEFTTILGL